MPCLAYRLTTTLILNHHQRFEADRYSIYHSCFYTMDERGRGRGQRHHQRGQRSAKSQVDRKPTRMDLMASISRSGGIDKDGNDLLNHKTQEEYRSFIQEKTDAYWEVYPLRSSKSMATGDAQRTASQENILILLRKLREGISSSRRKDAFAVECFETSLYLAVLFHSSRQTTAVLSHMVPDLYTSQGTPSPNRRISILISLLHLLVEGFPSQTDFRKHISRLKGSLVERDSAEYVWISSVAYSLRQMNYIIFEQLTDLDGFKIFLEEKKSSELGRQALSALIYCLRKRVRERTWTILRTAYREFACQNGSETRQWLTQTLALIERSSPHGETDAEVDAWLGDREVEGHIKRKEGVDGRWIVFRPSSVQPTSNGIQVQK